MKILSVIIIIIFGILAHANICMAEDEIFKCEGFYNGHNTNYKKIKDIISLTISERSVYTNGTYNFFGTDIKNPFSDRYYLNCGIEYKTRYRFSTSTCEQYNGSKMVMEESGDLNIVTMSLYLSSIHNDGAGEYYCTKFKF